MLIILHGNEKTLLAELNLFCNVRFWSAKQIFAIWIHSARNTVQLAFKG